MKSTRPWLLYSLLRIGIFAGVLAVLLVLQIEPWIAALIAAIVGLCVTYIFFRGSRDEVARRFYEFRNSEQRDTDADAENAALDSVELKQPTGQPLEGPRLEDHRLEGQRRRESDAE